MTRTLWVFIVVTSTASAALLWPVISDGAPAPVSSRPALGLPLPLPAPEREAGAPGSAGDAPLLPPGEAQEAADRAALGAEAYADLQRRWTAAQQAPTHAQALRLLVDVVRHYPATHRADCASLEMGRHWLADPERPGPERRDAAAAVLEPLAVGTRESRCAGEASAAHVAAWLLADQVYAEDAADKALPLLRQLARLPAGETDGEGHPLAPRAKALLARLVDELDDGPDEPGDEALDLPDTIP